MINFDPEKMQRRVEGMSDARLLAWLESALPGMQRHLDAYNRTQNPDHLGELAIAETTANLVITELMIRKFPVAEEVPPADSVPSELEQVTVTTSAPRRFLRRRAGKTGTANVPSEVTST